MTLVPSPSRPRQSGGEQRPPGGPPRAGTGALASFLLVLLALPPVGFWPAGLAAFVPLMRSLRRLSDGRSLLEGTLFGAWTGGYAFWGVYAYHPLAWLAATALCGGVLGVAAWACRRLSFSGLAWLAPLPWLLAEQVLQVAGVPWSLAVLVAGEPRLLQVAAAVGGGGVALALLFLQWGAASLSPATAGGRRRGVLMMLAAALVMAVDPLPEAGGTPLRVAVVQTDVPRGDTATAADSGRLESLLERRRELVERALSGEGGEGPDLILLPELSFPGFEFVGSPPLADLARRGGVTLILSSPHLLEDGRPVNAVFALGPAGRVTGLHLQSTTIPILERGYHADPRPAPLDSLPGRPGAMICYESSLPGPAGSLSRKGAGLLLVTASDAYAGPSILASLHLAIDRLRAIENRRYLIRAANGGPSAVIDPRGALVAFLGTFREGVLHASVRSLDGRPPYVRCAPLLRSAWWLAGVTALLLALARRRSAGRGAPSPRLAPLVLAPVPLIVALQVQHRISLPDAHRDRPGAAITLLPAPFPGGRGWLFDSFPPVSSRREAEAAALALLLRLHGRPVDPADLLGEGTPGGRLRDHGLCLSPVEEAPLARERWRAPWLGRFASGWPVTVREMDGEAVLFFEPRRRGWVLLERRAFARSMGREAFRLVGCETGKRADG